MTHENSNIDITGEVLQCLKPTAWLNDEVKFWFSSPTRQLGKNYSIQLDKILII